MICVNPDEYKYEEDSHFWSAQSWLDCHIAAIR